MKNNSLIRLNVLALAVLLCLLQSNLYAQITFAHDWAIRYNGGNVDDPKSICTDVRSNIYTTGYFEDSINMDAVLGRELLSNGLRDGYVNKLDSSGNPIWSLAIGGSSLDQCENIAYDGSSSLYVSGTFTGTVDFDPGPGVFNLTSAGQYDAFLIKLDTNGVFSWALSWGTWSNETGGKILIGSTTEVYMIGSFTFSVMDLDPSSGVQNTGSGGGTFIVKLTSSGSFVWGGDYTTSFFTSAALDGNGFIYLTGSCQGSTCDMDPGLSIINYATANNSNDIYLIKMNTNNGNYVWHRTIGNTGIDHAQNVGIDISGNVYITGIFMGNLDFNPGPGSFILNAGPNIDAFLCRIDPAGNFIDAVSLVSSTTDIEYCYSVQDIDGYFYLMGSFANTVDFDPGPLNYSLTSQYGGYDLYYMCLDSALNFQWASAMDGFGDQISRAFCLDPQGNIVSTHPLNGEIDTDLGIGTDSLFEFSNNDIFVTRMTRTVPLTTEIEAQPQTAFSIYPVPSSSVLHISFTNPQPISALHFYNINGKEVSISWSAAGQDEVVIYLDELVSGIYFIVCESENKIFSKKVIVNKD